MTDSTTETKLAHFEMQEAATGVTGDWRLAIPAASIELARLIGTSPDMPAERRNELIQIGAALLRGSFIVGVPDGVTGEG